MRRSAFAEHRHDTIHQKSPQAHLTSTANSTNPLTCSARPLLTRDEFEFCRRKVLTVLRKCGEIHFLRFSVLISCLLSCLRPLHQSEIVAIWRLVLGSVEEAEQEEDELEESAVAWLSEQCEAVVFLDVTGSFQFAHPLLPQFLKAVPISGFDRTQQTLAKACILQVEKDRAVQPSPKISSRPTAFSAYAAQSWQHHYRAVERQNAGLTARVHKLIFADRETGPHGLPNCAILEEGLTFCRRAQFKVLAGVYEQLLEQRHRFSGRSIPTGSGMCGCTAEPLTDLVQQQMSNLELRGLDSDEDEWVVL